MNQNLKQRVFSAIIGVPLILFLLSLRGIEGVALFSWVISMGMLYEFCHMFFTLADARRKIFLALCVTTVFHAFNYVFNSGLSAWILGIFPVLGFFSLFLFIPPAVDKLKEHVQELMALCFAMVYCVWFPILMVFIREEHNGRYWLIFTLLVIWSSDSLAYFAGKFFGRTPLYPAISPKKTWEGALGGTLGAVFVGLAYAHFFLKGESAASLIVIILTLSAAGIIGDLAESLLKRASNKKDSGSLIPGHGGFLDRFDGAVFAFPVMYVILKLVN